jgi:hypothetical protein
MPDQIILYAIFGAVSGLATVLWWLGKNTVAKLDSVHAALGSLQVSIEKDMGAIRERLARLEGHAGIGK